MAIRIMHVVEAFGVGGGVENGIANLIANLDSERFEHILCAVFRMGPQLDRYPLDRVRLVCLDQKPRRLSVQVGSLGRVIRDLRPDIVHSRNWGALESVVATRWTGLCPVIHSEHGFEVTPSSEPRRRSWIRRIVFQLAHRVFTVSDQLKHLLVERTGFPARKLSVIHNGVQLQRYRPDAAVRRQVRSEMGIREDEFCIGAVGRLNKIKDYPTLLRAAERFGGTSTNWRLCIVGEGTELASLQQLTGASSILRDRVRFMGANDRVPEFLNAMDVFVLPSLCEGISNSLLEAMATALPVIVTDTGGNPEVIDQGDAGLLFPVGDFHTLAEHLSAVRQRKDVRERLAARSRQRVEHHFSLEAMTRKYEEMYTHLGNSTAPKRMAFQNAV
jgi:sugar transferase (PEP-CTERM/EpsH1 system associated)